MPDLQLPSLNSEYTFYVGKTATEIDLSGIGNGDCQFTVSVTAQDTSSRRMLSGSP